MRTGKHLQIRQLGEAAQGVVLEGNPQKPEPIHFRTAFPGGEVDIVRCDDGDYWVHIRVNREGDDVFPPARITDARLDIDGRHTHEVNVGDFNDPGLYHLAVRVSRNDEGQEGDRDGSC